MLLSCKRVTKETNVEVSIETNGSGDVEVSTGIPLLDEMILLIGKAGDFNLKLNAVGDLETGDHHTIEDVGIAIGSALKTLVRGIGSSTVPCGSCLAVAAVNFGRPSYQGSVKFRSKEINGMAMENYHHMLRAIAYNGSLTMHIRADGGDDIDIIESTMTALGRALKRAITNNTK